MAQSRSDVSPTSRSTPSHQFLHALSQPKNADFGANFPRRLSSSLPAIPRDNSDFANADHAQALANTAAFHFAFIEQGGSSLYSAMAQKARDAEVSDRNRIGGDEVAHFSSGSTCPETVCRVPSLPLQIPPTA